MSKFKKPALAATVLATLVTLAACGDDTVESKGVEVQGAAEKGDAHYLADVCPATVAIQTDWNPQSEHGGLYQLLGGDAKIDTAKKRVSGTLVDTDGVDTGISIEVRSGGPAIGYDSPTNQLYADDSLYLGMVSTDDAMVASVKQPVTAVVAPLEISPTAIMWDAETNPDWKTIEDVKEAGAKVRYTNGLAYMEYLVNTGKLSKDQIDSSYDGTPGSFVADNGKAAQQGYGTTEPYYYEHELDSWGKPLNFQLVADTGYKIYVQALSMRSDRIAEEAACLEKLVPLLQQAQIDFINDGAAATELILKLVEEYNTGWQYSKGLAEHALKAQRELGIIDNGPDSTLGNMEMDRIAGLLDVMVPILQKQGVKVSSDLAPEDIATNEFIDPSIGLE